MALVMSVAGNAAAAVIISNNHQVAAHVIAGANPPAGGVKNLIAGSVGTTDLHPGAVTPAQLNGDARAHEVNFLATGAVHTAKTVLTLDELTVSVDCYGDFGGAPLQLHFTSSTAADLEYFGVVSGGSDSGLINGVPLAAGETHSPPQIMSGPGYSARMGLQVVYRNGRHVITLTLAAFSYFDANRECKLTGSALVATK
jgi:hypothetical protein